MRVIKVPKNAPREIPPAVVQKLKNLGNHTIQFHGVVKHGNHFRIRFDLTDSLGINKHGEVSRRRVRLYTYENGMTADQAYELIQRKDGAKIMISAESHLAE